MQLPQDPARKPFNSIPLWKEEKKLMLQNVQPGYGTCVNWPGYKYGSIVANNKIQEKQKGGRHILIWCVWRFDGVLAALQHFAKAKGAKSGLIWKTILGIWGDCFLEEYPESCDTCEDKEPSDVLCSQGDVYILAMSWFYLLTCHFPMYGSVLRFVQIRLQ